MDQFRQVGEVLGGIKALMVLKHDIPINQRQCCLLERFLNLAFDTVSEEIRQNLKLEEKNIKWKALENPMKELHRISKEIELYIRYCLDTKDWFGKAITLHQNKDCVEFHLHNLLSCFAVVVEAVETAGEISGPDQDDMQKKRQMLMKKYDNESNDPKMFQWRYGKQYLVPREVCNLFEISWKEDRWNLVDTIMEKKNDTSQIMSKHEQKISDFLVAKINMFESFKSKLLPAGILVGAKDYQVRRRLGSGGSRCKEIQWMGESFAMRNFFGEIDDVFQREMSRVLSLSHPHIVQSFCGFYDEERKEGFLVMELMSKSFRSYIKENCSSRKRPPFNLPSAVDFMLQIARGMEYLHSQKIFHGDLNPSNILLKPRNNNSNSSASEGYFYAKVKGFGLTSVKNYTSRSNQAKASDNNPVIWYAPEVLAEQEQPKKPMTLKFTEKSDVYSFGMLCFEILTGKIPFEEGHLQDDTMSRNIRAGERPLFPHSSPKYLVNLTRKCWQPEPLQRPSFSSICRILRYIKKCLVINPDHGHPDSAPPLVDYCEIEAGYSKLFPREGGPDFTPVWQVPFQMFSYKVVEKEKISGNKDKMWYLTMEAPHIWDGNPNDDPFMAGIEDQRSVFSDVQVPKLGGDQRSVCSETRSRQIPRRTYSSDQRSVCSDFMSRKMDQRSIASMTPDRRFISTNLADERFGRSELLERNVSDGNLKTVSEEMASEGTEDSKQKDLESAITKRNSLPSAAGDSVESRSLSRTVSESGKVLPSVAITSGSEEEFPASSEGSEQKASKGKPSKKKPAGPETTLERRYMARKKSPAAKPVKALAPISGNQKARSPSPMRTVKPKVSPRLSPMRTPKTKLVVKPAAGNGPCPRCSKLSKGPSYMSSCRRPRNCVCESQAA